MVFVNREVASVKRGISLIAARKYETLYLSHCSGVGKIKSSPKVVVE